MLRWLRQFFAMEALGGVVMLLSAAVALVMANSSLHGSYTHLLHWQPLAGWPLDHAVSELLMPIFFLMIGIELKHEMTHGALMTRAQKTLPLIAALGGVIVPALIYLTINLGSAEYRDGWAVPTATDIAFAMCVLSLVGRTIPATAKIFLLAIAIYDDLLAILVIALFFSHGASIWPLLGAGACVCVLIQLQRWKVHHAVDYLAIGFMMAVMLHHGSVHTTVAGMATGLCMPRRTAERMMEWLHPLVAFAILPLFAFVSAGVALGGATVHALLHPVSLGIMCGLFFGKQIGIFGATWLAVTLRLARKPTGTRWRDIYAISLLAGIGFTMSLLIGQLAFARVPAAQDAVKIGVLAASLLSAVAAMLFVKTTCRQPRMRA